MKNGIKRGRQRCQKSITLCCMGLVLFVLEIGYAQYDPFGGSSFVWASQDLEGGAWRHVEGSWRITIQSCKEFAGEAFADFFVAIRKTPEEFRAIFEEVPGSADNQAAVVDRMFQEYNTRNAQLDMTAFLVNSNKTQVLLGSFLFPTKQYTQEVKAEMIPLIATLRQGQWRYAVADRSFYSRFSGYWDKMDAVASDFDVWSFNETIRIYLEEREALSRQPIPVRPEKVEVAAPKPTKQEFPSYLEEARYLLARDLAVFGNDVSDRFIGNHIDILVATQLDKTLEGKTKPLREVGFDDLCRAMSPFLVATNVSFDLVDSDQLQTLTQKTPTQALVKRWSARKHNRDKELLETLNKEWQDRHLRLQSPEYGEFLSKLNKDVTTGHVLAEIRFQVGPAAYAWIYVMVYGGNPEQSGNYRVDLMMNFLKESEFGDWVENGSAKSSVLGQRAFAELPLISFSNNDAVYIERELLKYAEKSEVFRINFLPEILKVLRPPTP